jgi:hypothetical protein
MPLFDRSALFDYGGPLFDWRVESRYGASTFQCGTDIRDEAGQWSKCEVVLKFLPSESYG